MIGFIGTSITITTNYNSSQSMTVSDSLHSWLDYECLPFCCDWLGSDLRVGHFFSFRCPLVNTPQLNTRFLTNELRLNHWNLLNWTEFSSDGSLANESESYVTTDGQPASRSWNKAPIWGLRPDLYYGLTVAGLLIWSALSDERTGLS
jgi:hypothetical protein